MAIFNFLAAYQGLCSGNRNHLLLCFFTTCYLAYIALGGLCFLLLEGPQENAQQKNLMIAKANFMKKYPCVTEEALDDFLNEASSFRIRGLAAPNATSKWSYSEAVFFSVTLITTVGYGHITPVTPVGKAVCMVYTGLGIPFTLLLLAAYVQRLMWVAEALQKALLCCLDQTIKPSIIRLIHLAIIMVSIILLCFLLPALVFSHLEEGWTYLDALYFCFISLTTVGLGDYVPGLSANQPYGDVYRFAVTFYVVAGVTIMMFMMSLTAEFQQSNSAYQTEKSPMNVGTPVNLESYGSILVHNTKIIDERDKHQIIQP